MENYTLENPLVKLNPYFINPLAAVILFKTEKEVAVTVRVLGKTPEATMEHTFPKATTHILPVLGLYGGYETLLKLNYIVELKIQLRFKLNLYLMMFLN